MPPKPTIGYYVRVSTDQQSTDSQRDVLKTYGKAQGWTSLDYSWYEDKITGTHDQRPALQKMLKDVESGRITTVVVTRLDRLSRSTMDGLKTLSYLADKGVRVVAVQQNIEWNGAMGRMLSAIFLAIAQFERDTIVSRVREGLQAAKARGVRLGRKPNLEKRAEIKRLKESGLGVTAIAHQLGITRQSVYRMLA